MKKNRRTLDLLPPGLRKLLRGSERGRGAEAFDRWHLEWLFDFVERGEVLPDDVDMAASFTTPTYAGPKPRTAELRKFAAEVASELRRFLLDHQPWTFPLREVRAVLEAPVTAVALPPAPPRAVRIRPATMFESSDWRTAFRLRAAELVAQYGERCRQCQRKECGRLFFADDPRQRFCEPRCTNLKRLHAFRAESKSEKSASN